MTPDAQRIAIAGACGWTRLDVAINRPLPHRDIWVNPERDGRAYVLVSLPDYLNDLNAMHEAERQHETKGRFGYDFIECLKFVILSQSKLSYPGLVGEFRLANATAAQRAEAFLRTLNLWTV